MTNPIAAMTAGAAAGLGVMQSFASNIMVLYPIIMVLSFVILFKETVNASDFQKKAIQHFFSIIVIWVVFGFSSGTSTTSTITNTALNGNSSPNTISGVPVGLAYSMTVVDEVMGYAGSALATATTKHSGVDTSKTPAVTEQYKLNVENARKQVVNNQGMNEPTVRNYFANCIDMGLYNNPVTAPQSRTGVYSATLLKQPASADCTAKQSALLSSQQKAVNDAAANANVEPRDVDMASKPPIPADSGLVGDIAGVFLKGLLAVVINIVGLFSQTVAYIYANTIPYFLGIIATMYFAIYPIVLARAMFPGQWGILITYIEGYAWLCLIPIIIQAVDGFSWRMGQTGLLNASLFSLSSALTDLAKIAIVMMVPALASFLMFGQRPNHFQGLSGASAAVVSGALMAAGVLGKVVGGSKGASGSASKAALAEKEATAKADKSLAGGARDVSSLQSLNSPGVLKNLSTPNPGGAGGIPSAGSGSGAKGKQAAGNSGSPSQSGGGSLISAGHEPDVKAEQGRLASNSASLQELDNHLQGIPSSTNDGSPKEPLPLKANVETGMLTGNGMVGASDAVKTAEGTTGATYQVQDPSLNGGQAFSVDAIKTGEATSIVPNSKTSDASALNSKVQNAKPGVSQPVTLTDTKGDQTKALATPDNKGSWSFSADPNTSSIEQQKASGVGKDISNGARYGVEFGDGKGSHTGGGRGQTNYTPGETAFTPSSPGDAQACKDMVSGFRNGDAYNASITTRGGEVELGAPKGVDGKGREMPAEGKMTYISMGKKTHSVSGLKGTGLAMEAQNVANGRGGGASRMQSAAR
jgi:hypothetical protein